ncbi:MAG: xanthine dehydrogenase molybdopterin binding subunit, partial [Candidatus Parcubacteria bacterium]|nr:xanthine dehydrogenase molybdopterin binding subunit [Leptolyngbyaceae cyanobacterium LF-bin-113]
MSVGKRKSHESAEAHVSGTAIYTDDQRLPAGMLSLFPVLAPHARARITKIDVSAAYEVEGVVTVLTADDVPGENNTGVIVHDEILLATDEVSYWGQAVIWVAGETEEAARLGAEKIVVEYEPLDPILSIKDAIVAQSFHHSPQVVRRGDPQTALQSADFCLSG